MRPAAPDVVFVFPPASGHVGAFGNHLGAAYLRAALARDGISTDQYLDESPGPVDVVVGRILKKRPRIVGFTVYDANLPLALALSRRIREVAPDVTVLFGGPTPTFGAARLLERHPVVDACLIGEAEETAAPIFRRFLGGGQVDLRLPGLAARHNGVVVSSRLPRLVGSDPGGARVSSPLDVTRSPYLSGVLADGRAGILTSRGCPHHCQYCAFAALGRKTLRLHSIDRVLDELDVIASHQKRTRQQYVVPIHDDAFTLLPERASALCQAIVGRGLRLQFSCSTRADRIDDSLLALMRRAGFVSLSFGLESAVPSVLRATGKVRPPDWPDADLGPEREFVERIGAGVRAAKRLGFTVGVSIILGLPSETRRDAEATLRFVAQLPVDYYVHNFLAVFPGTPLAETHSRWGIRTEVDELGLLDTTQHAFDVAGPKPRRRCELDEDARLVRLRTIDALFGCGTPGNGRCGLEAAVIRDGVLREDVVAWVARRLNVGGVLVQAYPRRVRGGPARDLDRDRGTLEHVAVPAGHYAQLIPEGAPVGSERWSISSPGVDLYVRHRSRLLFLRVVHRATPLLAWCRGFACSAALCDPLGDSRSLSSLGQHLEAKSDVDFGQACRSRPFPPGLIHPGRWLKGGAACRSLRRIEIDAAGAVRTCSLGEPIGRVGDNATALSRRLDEVAAGVERRRGCADCGLADCPRCPFPGLSDRDYCGLMAAKGRLLPFLSRIQVYSRLPLVFALQRARLESG
jgi:radical SAM superfamily enzyme YgiQ (UPF0313 family)